MAGQRKPITWKVDANGCWICTSHAPDTHGYPHLWKDGMGHLMHSTLYQEKFGELPPGIVVRHKCDNRMCINLKHMETGTPADNSNDMRVRGRCNTPRGEKRSDAKLRLVDVLAIQESTEPQSVIAERYGINQSTVSRIKSGKRWPDRKVA